MIQSGDVAYELARPVFLPLSWLARAFADRTAPVLLRAIPQFVFSLWILPLVGWHEIALIAPASGWSLAWFLVSALLGSLVAAAIGLIATATMFWTITGTGTAILVSTVVWVLSGVNIPLPLFPAWFQPVIRILPFRAMLDTPFQIYLGTTAPGAIAGALLLQVAWAVALFLAAWYLISRGTRRVVVQGG
jgi:ABC-2 type transport system permease protein